MVIEAGVKQRELVVNSNNYCMIHHVCHEKNWSSYFPSLFNPYMRYLESSFKKGIITFSIYGHNKTIVGWVDSTIIYWNVNEQIDWKMTMKIQIKIDVSLVIFPPILPSPSLSDCCTSWIGIYLFHDTWETVGKRYKTTMQYISGKVCIIFKLIIFGNQNSLFEKKMVTFQCTLHN